MKKKSVFGSLLKIGAIAGITAGVIYVCKDKLQESEILENLKLKEKFDSAKDFVENKLRKSDDFEYDTDDFEDDDFDVPDDSSGEREYVSINITSTDETEEDNTEEI